MSKPPFQPSCRSCFYWGKPANKQARADYLFECHATIPTYEFPLSFVGQIDKRPMGRDDGQDCPAWRSKLLGEP